MLVQNSSRTARESKAKAIETIMRVQWLFSIAV
jgi:hypothetical protein